MRYNTETDMVEIYYNGQWNTWLHGTMQSYYLYKQGDYMYDRTGGYTSYAYRASHQTSINTGSPTLTYETSCMKIHMSVSNSIGSVYAEQKIDVTNYTKLYIKWIKDFATTTIGSGWVYFGLSTQKSNNHDEVIHSAITNGSNYKSTEYIDITNLTGDYYFFIALYASNGSEQLVTVTDIWME